MNLTNICTYLLMETLSAVPQAPATTIDMNSFATECDKDYRNVNHILIEQSRYEAQVLSLCAVGWDEPEYLEN